MAGLAGSPHVQSRSRPAGLYRCDSAASVEAHTLRGRAAVITRARPGGYLEDAIMVAKSGDREPGAYLAGWVAAPFDLWRAALFSAHPTRNSTSPMSQGLLM